MTGKLHFVPRGVPQDRFEVNLDMKESLGENAVSTAGLSVPHRRRDIQIRKASSMGPNRCQFCIVRKERESGSHTSQMQQRSVMLQVSTSFQPTRKIFNWVGSGVDCHALSKSIFEPPVMSVPRFKIGDQAHLHVWDGEP
jgi:hypothetical protein